MIPISVEAGNELLQGLKSDQAIYLDRIRQLKAQRVVFKQRLNRVENEISALGVKLQIIGELPEKIMAVHEDGRLESEINK